MDGARVGDSLVRHVPELADGRLTLLSCTPQRLRAKDQEWVARYQLSVSPWAQNRVTWCSWKPLGAVAAALPRADVHDDVPFGEEGWSCWMPDLRLALRHEESDEHCRRCRCSSSPRRRHSCCSPSSRRRLPRRHDRLLRPGGRALQARQPVHRGRRDHLRRPQPAVTADTGRPQDTPGRQGPDGVGGDDRALEGLVGRGVLGMAPGVPAGGADPRPGPVPEDITLKELARNAFAEGRPSSSTPSGSASPRRAEPWRRCTSRARSTGSPPPSRTRSPRSAR